MRSGTEQGRPSALCLVAGMSGNLMEWYDFALYGVFAATLGELFFPHAGRLLGLLAVFGVFAAGYVMRLAGGAIFGHVGDRLGRRRALLISAATMAISTSLVGCLPTYASLGMLAPVLFTVLRLLQGLSVGGEFTTSITFLVEQAPPGRRGLQGSLAGLTAGVGILLGSAIGNALLASFDTETVLAWAWRLPFLLSLPLGVSILVLRSTLPEDGTDEAPAAEAPSPVWTVLRDHPADLLRGALLGWSPSASFYLIAVFLGSFLATEHLLTEQSALGLQTTSIALIVVLTPLAGHLSDLVGRKPMMIASTVGALLASAPLLAVLRNGDRTDDLFAELAFCLFIVAGSPYQVWLAERFPRAVRATGLGIAYNGAAGILGGLTPLACTTLIEVVGSELAPAIYVSIAAAVSLVVAIGTPETARVERIS